MCAEIRVTVAENQVTRGPFSSGTGASAHEGDMKANFEDSAESASDQKAATVSWLDPRGNLQTRHPTPALLSEDIYTAQKLRTGSRYRQQRNYHGLNWFANTTTHVWYESMFERQALLWLDFNKDIVAIAAQPMRMDFTDGSYHFPDFLALHSDHKQVVYDVKPLDLLLSKAKAQFAKTAELCKTVGWGFEVFAGIDKVTRDNLDWLSNFRQPYFSPPPAARARLAEALLDSTLTMRDAADALGLERTTRLPALYHLAWMGDILLDLTTPLSKSTLIEGNNHVHA